MAPQIHGGFEFGRMWLSSKELRRSVLVSISTYNVLFSFSHFKALHTFSCLTHKGLAFSHNHPRVGGLEPTKSTHIGVTFMKVEEFLQFQMGVVDKLWYGHAVLAKLQA